MALYTGQHGAFPREMPDGRGNSLQEAASVRSWQINMTQQMLPQTRLGDTWEDRLGGLKSITGTAEIYYYRNNNGSDSTVLNCLTVFYKTRRLEIMRCCSV